MQMHPLLREAIMTDDKSSSTSGTSTSGGVNINSDQTNIGGGVTGRDKIVSAGGHIVHAEAGATVIIGSEQPAMSAKHLPYDLAELEHLLNQARTNLALIQERQAEYVLSTDIPLQLIKEERQLETKIRWLERKIVEFKPIAVLRRATKLITGPLAEVLTGEPDQTQRKRWLDQASLLPHARYLDIPALETAVDKIARLTVELEILLRAYALEPNAGALQGLRHHAAPLIDLVQRIYCQPIK